MTDKRWTKAKIKKLCTVIAKLEAMQHHVDDPHNWLQEGKSRLLAALSEAYLTRDCHPDPHDEHICISHGNAWWPTGQECCNEAQREIEAVADQIRSNNERAFAEIFGRIAQQARKQ